jgi:catechol 1,2-dioxygenase
VYADYDPNLETDVQFGVTRALVADFRRHDEPHPAEPEIEAPWYTLDYTFTLEPGVARLPPSTDQVA